MSALDVTGDLGSLVAALVDAPSESGSEGPLASAVAEALGSCAHLAVERDGDAVIARTDRGLAERVVIAGHLDTVPIAGNVPSRREGTQLHGCGSSDMKGGIAVMLRLAATVTTPTRDVTYVFYDCEEVESARNGLRRLVAAGPDRVTGDLAILMEPTSGVVEAGCQGTLRGEIHLTGVRAHSARSWLGSNAIHAAAPVLATLSNYEPRSVDIDGCVYREGLSAVRIDGGVAGNVIPDECTVVVNFRFAPDRTEEAAVAHVREVFAPHDVEVTDLAGGALPGLTAPAVSDFVGVVGAAPTAKYGWTDVARFATLGVPALNYGPGDPNLAHTRDEWVDLTLVERCADVLARYLALTP